MRLIAALAVLTVSAWGQDVTRVYNFAHIDTPKGFQSVAVTVTGIANVQNVSVQPSPATLTVTGTAAQLALTDWLFPQLDQPSAQSASGDHTYTTTGDLGTVRVFTLAHAQSPAHIQEIVNVIRTTADLQRAFVVWNSPVVAVRGTAEQVSVTAWLIAQLDAAAPTPGAPTQSNQITARFDPQIRILHPARTTAPLALQEVVNTLRTTLDVNRVFPVNSVGAVVFRGDPDQAALGEWLMGQLDQAGGQQAPAPHQQQYVAPGDKVETQVRVFYLLHAATPTAMLNIASAVRVGANLNRVFVCTQPKAVTLRGSPQQVAQAADLIAQLDR